MLIRYREKQRLTKVIFENKSIFIHVFCVFSIRQMGHFVSYHHQYYLGKTGEIVFFFFLFVYDTVHTFISHIIVVIVIVIVAKHNFCFFRLRSRQIRIPPNIRG